MNPETDHPLDARLAVVAARQYGLVTLGQLRSVGVGDTGIRERVRSRRLHRLHRGVYAVGHRELKAEAFWLAAVLACGPGAALSHHAAAAHLNIRRSDAPTIDVTVPARSGRLSRKGIRVHRSGRLAPEDVAAHEGIPVTTVARTLVDLADVLPAHALKRTIDEAEYKRVLDLRALVAAVERNPGRRGATVLKLAKAPMEMTRSRLEQCFLALVERHGLPRPAVALPIEGYEADFAWPEYGLVVETDDRGSHGTRAAFEHDRLRDRRLLRAGFRTIRLTGRALRYDEEAIVADLEAVLSRSRASS